METIHEEATVTSKGQITLPKAIRQALGVSVGEKVAFKLRGSQVVVSRVEDGEHQDPAIAGFLALLEQDIRRGKRIADLPEELLAAMTAAKKQTVDPEEDIEGNVAL